MWYTPVSGIWQSVWLESVPAEYIQRLNIENRGASVTITTEPALEGKVILAGQEYALVNGSVTITPENPHLWSPEDPYLYDFAVETAQDRVESYFALRTLETKVIDGIPRLCLNGKPYFFHGLLDQGYWPDGLLTPAAPECYADDILAMKNLGFNMLRKHIKVEPEEFYYQCDKLGMIVFQDMVNNGDYSFFRDTALPTVGLKSLPDGLLHRDPATREAVIQGMVETVAQLREHPCICCWTNFNEGWGQFAGTAMYHHLKELDSTRFIDTASGWFRPAVSDVVSEHVYFKPVKLQPAEKPIFLSEFGGYVYRVDGHVFNPDKTYGYRIFDDRQKFENALIALYENEVIPHIAKGLCATVYTQLSDVEDETNGLLTYDRKVCKIDASRMREIAEQIKKGLLP
jgi:beta-galactosidase/beta-glucuronidase